MKYKNPGYVQGIVTKGRWKGKNIEMKFGKIGDCKILLSGKEVQSCVTKVIITLDAQQEFPKFHMELFDEE